MQRWLNIAIQLYVKRCTISLTCIRHSFNAPDMSLALGKVRRAQRTLSKIDRTARTRRFQGTLQPQLRNWIRAALSRVDPGGHIAPGASEWLLVEPIAPCFTVSASTWSIMIRMRLQIPVSSSECRCSVFSNNSQTVCDAPLDRWVGISGLRTTSDRLSPWLLRRASEPLRCGGHIDTTLERPPLASRWCRGSQMHQTGR